MEVQWFPGHMAKTLKQIQENTKLVDFVIELLDARIPRSSSNPELVRLIPHQKRVVVLNKSDLANIRTTCRWIEHYHNKSIPCFAIDSVKGDGIREFLGQVLHMGMEVQKKWQKRGRQKKPIRVMITGIPNVGKSSLINRIAKKSAARTGNKPGVTRGRQWVKLTNRIDLLDTPGILWPKFDDPQVGINLALTGAVKEEITDVQQLSVKLIEKLITIDGSIITKNYNIEKLERTDHQILEQVGRARGYLIKGGRVDLRRASVTLLNDYRTGRLGRISLESPKSTWD